MSAQVDGLTRMGHRLHRDRPLLAAALLASAALHMIAGLLFPRSAPPPPRAVRAPTEIIDIETAPALPKPAPETPPSTPQPAAGMKRAPARKGPKPMAQAGQVVIRVPAAADPLDFANETVTGRESSYAGGSSAATGTSRSVVRGAAGPPGPDVGEGGTAPGVNLSRAPSMADGASWQCPFPPEADGVDEATVQLRVFVGPDGRALDAILVADPGHGFGIEAVRCAIGKRWSPALDRAGNPIRASAIVKVRFTR